MNDQMQMFHPSNGLEGYRERLVQRNTVTISPSAKPTSAAAALRALPRTGTYRKRIYDYLIECGGATDEEIEHALGISGNTVRPTRGSLVKDRLVVETDVERPTHSGNMAIVWMAL
jgi:hypothetical protein